MLKFSMNYSDLGGNIYLELIYDSRGLIKFILILWKYFYNLKKLIVLTFHSLYI